MLDAKNIQILVVDDSPTIRGLISKYLETRYSVLFANDGEEAWQLIQTNSFTLIFLDMHMPVLNGMQLLQQIRSSDNEKISNLPVIMITGHEDTEAAKQASYKMGATDFISKPFSEVDIVSRIKPYTELNQKITQLEKTVSHDSLTGLYNENGFREIAVKTVSGACRHGLTLSVLNIQIANIDDIINKRNRRVVEQIIISVSSSLTKSLRREDVLSYFGHGHYSALLPMTKVFKAHIVAMRFQAAINKLVFKINDETIKIKIGIGLTSTEEKNQNARFDELYTQANQALEASLRHAKCNIFRHNELNAKDLNKTATNTALISPAVTADFPAKEEENTIDVSMLNLDTPTYNSYITGILNGNFESIPIQCMENMIEPLELFLKYAIEQVESEKPALKVSD